ncbi:MAG TPA: hypothetical protein VHV47_01540 [Opitutaceae bacterium]|jgi:hypothetical protein|nr:hypothetical protein [Opitutaceae bacterium]
MTQAFEISHFETASKTDLQLAIAQVETRLIRWMFVFWVGQVGVTVATVLIAIHVLKN